MKPCSKNRKYIAWLATDALDVRSTRSLRAHLATCEGCRRYLAEISSVTRKLAGVEIKSDVQTSEAFHQRIVRALRAEETASRWEILVAQLRETLADWRVALPVIGAAALVIAAWSVLVWRPGVHLPVPADAQTVLAPTPKSDPPPTIGHYQMVASQSLEKLDELLTRQGNRNPSPTPTYTASTLANVMAAD